MPHNFRYNLSRNIQYHWDYSKELDAQRQQVLYHDELDEEGTLSR